MALGNTARLDLADKVILGLVTALALLWLAPIIWVIGLSFKPNEVLMRDTRGIFSAPLCHLSVSGPRLPLAGNSNVTMSPRG
jgi:ABC-type glycerol-3-phosphate transport system permease component